MRLNGQRKGHSTDRVMLLSYLDYDSLFFFIRNLYKLTVWRKVGDCLNETFYPRDMSVKPLDYQLIALNGTERNRSKKHPIEEREQHLGWKQHSCMISHLRPRKLSLI